MEGGGGWMRVEISILIVEAIQLVHRPPSKIVKFSCKTRGQGHDINHLIQFKHGLQEEYVMQRVINFYFAAYKFDNPLFHAFLPYIWPRFPTAVEKYFLLLIEV